METFPTPDLLEFSSVPSDIDSTKIYLDNNLEILIKNLLYLYSKNKTMETAFLCTP